MDTEESHGRKGRRYIKKTIRDYLSQKGKEFENKMKGKRIEKAVLSGEKSNKRVKLKGRLKSNSQNLIICNVLMRKRRYESKVQSAK